MTTRLKGLTVVLEDDIREDDAECIINAIRMIKGVQDVVNIEATDEDYIVESRLKLELMDKILDIFRK